MFGFGKKKLSTIKKNRCVVKDIDTREILHDGMYMIGEMVYVPSGYTVIHKECNNLREEWLYVRKLPQ